MKGGSMKVSEMNIQQILAYIADICGIEMYNEHNESAYLKIALKLEELLQRAKNE